MKRYVRFGSKADMCSANRHVRFTPKSGHVQCTRRCPLCANSGHLRSNNLYSITSSARPTAKRDSKAERLGGLEVEEQFDFRDLLDRQFARLCAFENPAGIDADLAICVRTTASVAHQTAGCGELAILEDCRHSVTERQCAELFAPANEECVGGDNEAACPQLDQLAKTASKSRSVLAFRTWSCRPRARAAACTLLDLPR